MGKRWKCLAALGLAVLLGCMLPMSTMKAAAELTGEAGIDIGIECNGDMEDNLTGEVVFNNFINQPNTKIGISVKSSGDSGSVSLSYHLDTTGNSAVKSDGELASLNWTEVDGTYYSVGLNGDGKYVVYVRAVQDGQTVYARSKGIVLDTVAPRMTALDGTEMKSGDSYPEGTKFKVTDENLKSVSINDADAALSPDGIYEIEAKGSICTIKAEDMAANKVTWTIIVTDEGEKPDEDDKPEDDITVITESGTYSLHADTAYRLGGGKWSVNGDRTVYYEGITFYVSSDGDYQFKKH